MNTFTASNKTEWYNALKKIHEGDIIEALNDFEADTVDGGFVKQGKYRMSPTFYGPLKDLIEATKRGEWPPKSTRDSGEM